MRPVLVLVGLAAAATAAIMVAIAVGSVTIPVPAIWSFLVSGDAGDPQSTILLERIRMPRVMTAALAGAGLAVAGLLMQTLFANPLADPYILGVSSGASLGVAVVTLGSGVATTSFVGAVGAGRLGVVAAAGLGSAGVLVLIVLLGRWVRSIVTLLIMGVMLSSGIGALVSLFLAFADPARLQRFIIWGFGSYAGVTRDDVVYLAAAIGLGLLGAALLTRSLNALLLGERYAQSLGVNVALVRLGAVLVTSLVAGSVTAYCGPIAFLGIAIPHLARLVIGTSDHRILMPAAVLMGIAVSEACSVLAQAPGADAVLPLNVVSALIGAPVVIAVLLRSRRLAAGAV